MKLIYTILFFTCVMASGQCSNIDFDILKAFWNKETNTLDIILNGEDRSLQYIYSNYENIDLEFNDDGGKSFELFNVTKGLKDLSKTNKSLPRKFLVLLDHFSYQNNKSNYHQIISEILAKNNNESIIHLAIMSQRLSELKSITKFNSDETLRELTNQIDSKEKSNYRRIFKSFEIDQYRKIFFLTAGEAIASNLKYEDYSQLLSKDQLGDSQIIPVTREEVVNESFLQFIRKLNNLSTGRENWGIVPSNKTQSNESIYDPNLIALKFQLTTEKRLQSNKSHIKLTFQNNEISIAKHKTVFLNSFTDPVLSDHTISINERFKQILFLGGLLSLILYYFIPIYNRINFKKEHVFTYSEVKEEGKKHNDPLKMSHIKDTDAVVKYGNDIMLLDSWKYIKENMSNPKYAKEYAHFFDQGIDGDIFTETQGIFKYTLAIWLACVLATVSSLLYILISQNVLVNWSSIEIITAIKHSQISATEIVSNAYSFFVLFISTVIISTIILKSYNGMKNIVFLLFKIAATILLTIVCLFIVNYIPTIDGPLFIDIKILLFLLLGIVITLLSHSNSEKLSVKMIFKVITIAASSYLIFVLFNSYFLSHFLNDTLTYFVTSLIFLSVIGIIITEIKTVSPALCIQIISPPDLSDNFINIREVLTQDHKEFIKIGRDPTSDIQVKWLDLCATDNHASISILEEQLVITPNNGEVIINGEKITQNTFLSESDEISLGDKSTTLLKILNTKNSNNDS